jgi:hypothetical protein
MYGYFLPRRQAFPPLVTAEVVFWLRMMRDHAAFIDLGLPGGSRG